MGGLANAKVEELTRFMPVLLNQLFRLMCTADELAVDALVVIADVLNKVRAEAGDLLMAQYHTYVFSNISPGSSGAATKAVWEVLVGAWLNLLRLGSGSSSMNTNPESITSVSKVCGFLLEVFSAHSLSVHGFN